jgi:hypothetical protein
MKIRLMGLALALSALIGWVVGCETDQPPGACKASHSSNYGIFDLTSAPDAGECSALTGDFVFMSKYNEPGSTENKLAISVGSVAGEFLEDERVQSVAELTHASDYPNEPTDGVCVAENITPVELNLPAIDKPLPDGGVETLPPVNRTYRFSNVRVVSTPLVPGTQWTADLEYTAGGCTSTYAVIGISPLVSCHEVFLDEEENLLPVLDDAGLPIMVPEKCQQPVTLDDGGMTAAVSDITGETTNIAFDLECDPKPRVCPGHGPCHVCRPAGEVPALLD